MHCRDASATCRLQVSQQCARVPFASVERRPANWLQPHRRTLHSAARRNAGVHERSIRMRARPSQYFPTHATSRSGLRKSVTHARKTMICGAHLQDGAQLLQHPFGHRVCGELVVPEQRADAVQLRHAQRWAQLALNLLNSTAAS